MITLLLADDEVLVRGGIKFALSEMDLNIALIEEVSNGADAMEQLIKHDPDILITDIKMPLVDGLALIRRIRESKRQTQIIIISGYADFAFAKQAMQYGVLHYVLKPIKATELKEALQACIAKIDNTVSDRSSGAGVAQMIAYIKLHYNKNITLEELAVKFSFSTKYLTNLIKKQTGKSFIDYITELRMETAVSLLSKTEMKIKDIAFYVGYDDPQYFHRVFKNKTGKTPAHYRQEL